MKPNIKFLFIFAVLIAVDQIAKNTFSNYICNKNIAWNIPIVPAIFYFIWTIIIAVLLYIFLKTKNYNQKIFLILILSGAISNMIDRIRFSCVIDYIDLKFWPVFNLGDVYITVGVIFVLLNFLRNPSPLR